MASFPKVILVGSLSLFSIIGVLAVAKKQKDKNAADNQENLSVEDSSEAMGPSPSHIDHIKYIEPHTPVLRTSQPAKLIVNEDDEDDVDRIYQFYSTGPNKLPIVETISYTSRVPWLKGRPAWIADYASHFKTSRHFIARSLNGKPDYYTQKVAPGDRFNVLRTDMNFNFYLLVDLSRCKMYFYYIDLDTNERVLLKTYKVGVGRFDDYSESGTLTPLGRFTLGEKIAIYKPGIMGFFQGSQTEMVQVFGTRWIPFEPAEENNNRAYKGYGIHGAPLIPESSGEFIEDQNGISKYDSDGCVRLANKDMEELFSIVITRPTVVEIVRDKALVELPGFEKNEDKKSLEFAKDVKSREANS
ncbi:MAG: hypothetical protein Tsb0015_13430 [Simkaniaceae bacterium]